MDGVIISETKKIYKVIKYIMIFNILIILAFKIGTPILTNMDLLFRGWVSNFYILNILSLIITGLILIKEYICMNMDYKFKEGRSFIRLLATLITSGLVVISCIGALFISTFSKKVEHVIIKNDQKVVAKVSTSYHDTYVEFYEPVGIFLMKTSTIEGEKYSGTVDPYDK